MTAEDVTRVQIPYYESFLGDIGKFTIKDVDKGVLDKVWSNTAFYGMKATGYQQGNHATESWLISPTIVLPDTQTICLSFAQALNYGTAEATKVKISEDGGGTWKDLDVPNTPSGNSWTFYSNNIFLDTYAGKNVRLAFVYQSTENNAPTWEIKDFSVIIIPTSGQCGETLYWNFDVAAASMYITGTSALWDSIAVSQWSEFSGFIHSLTLPEGLTSIGRYAFGECKNLTSVALPSSLTIINAYAFYGCSGLIAIDLPSSVESVWDYAFGECTSITAPVFNKHVFAYLPTSYTGEYTIPEGIKVIAGGSFAKCMALRSVSIPNSVYAIGNHAFINCSALTSIEIPNGVANIRNFTFAHCGSLTSVVIPASVGNIYDLAFWECTHLVSVTNCAETPQSIAAYDVFKDINLSSCTLYVPKESVDLYKAANVWKEFGSILALPDELTAIDEINSSSLPEGDRGRLVLRDGQIFILRGDKTYTITCSEVK